MVRIDQLVKLTLMDEPFAATQHYRLGKHRRYPFVGVIHKHRNLSWQRRDRHDI